MKPLAFFIFFALLVPGTAAAQLHVDASAQVGVNKRVATNRPPGGADAGFGGVGQLTAHVALLPLVRVGGYVGHEIAAFGDATRDITWGGLHVKVMSPVLRQFKPYVFLGFGYAGVYQRSYERSVFEPNAAGGVTKKNALVQGAGGGYFDVPLGIGASYKLVKPLELVCELGVHLGFAHKGSAYEDPGPQLSIAGEPDNNQLPLGIDRLSVGLTVGVLFDL